MSLYVKFVGAIGTVTGSCTWLYHEPTDTQFLVDCGMYQGEAKSAQLNSQPFPFDSSKIAFVLLTHAHIDHCGLIPLLHRRGFCGEVWCNEVTAELTENALIDAVNLCDGLYDRRDLKKVKFHPIVDDLKPVRLAENLHVEMIRTSHILGSVAFQISCWSKEDRSDSKTICFSGDIGSNSKENCYQALLKGRQYPAPYCDYIVSESTYGDRDRDIAYMDFESRIEAFASVIERAYSVEGTPLILIPAFSLQRTQELLTDLLYIITRYFDENPDKFQRPGRSLRYLAHKGITQTELERALSLKVVSEATANEIRSLFTEIDNRLTIEESDLSEKQEALLTNTFGSMPTQPMVSADSPLAQKYSQIFKKWLLLRKPSGKEADFKYLNDHFLERFGINVEDLEGLFAQLLMPGKAMDRDELPFPNATIRQKKTISKNFPSILLSSSGMCEHGPVRDHIEVRIEDPNTTIILCGYQGGGTLGSKLLDVKRYREGDLKDFSIMLRDSSLLASDVKARIEDLSPYYSGHADTGGIVDFIMNTSGRNFQKSATLFLNHGSNASREQLKSRLEKENHNSLNNRPITDIHLPDQTWGWFDLGAGKPAAQPIGIQTKQKNRQSYEDGAKNPPSEVWQQVFEELKEQTRIQKEILALLKQKSEKSGGNSSDNLEESL